MVDDKAKAALARLYQRKPASALAAKGDSNGINNPSSHEARYSGAGVPLSKADQERAEAAERARRKQDEEVEKRKQMTDEEYWKSLEERELKQIQMKVSRYSK